MAEILHQLIWRISHHLIGFIHLKGCFNTPLEHTPKPFTNRLWRDSFHSWLGGLPGVCSKGVLQFSWNTPCGAGILPSTVWPPKQQQKTACLRSTWPMTTTSQQENSVFFFFGGGGGNLKKGCQGTWLNLYDQLIIYEWMKGEWWVYPYHPCMIYLPAFGWFSG